MRPGSLGHAVGGGPEPALRRAPVRCSVCGQPSPVVAETLDPRYPVVKCGTCGKVNGVRKAAAP